MVYELTENDSYVSDPCGLRRTASSADAKHDRHPALAEMQVKREAALLRKCFTLVIRHPLSTITLCHDTYAK
jgi:hypothetical protein